MPKLTKLEQIEAILAFDESADAYDNLHGARIDLERFKADKVCLNTIDRVMQQLLSVKKVITDSEG